MLDSSHVRFAIGMEQSVATIIPMYVDNVAISWICCFWDSLEQGLQHHECHV